MPRDEVVASMEALERSENPVPRTWVLRSKGIHEVVQAPDQWAAWDTLQDRPLSDFGLITSAEPDENTDPFLVHTATLFRRWGRNADADQADALAHNLGLR